MKKYLWTICWILVWIVIWWITVWSFSTEQKNEINFDTYKTFPALSGAQESISWNDKKAPLTQQWKEIINQIRTHQTPTDFFKEEQNNEGLCAGYVYELSRALWWDLIVNTIGLHHPKNRVACDARELPYCYRYQWWTVLTDIWEPIGPQLKKNPSSFPSLVTQEDLIRLFSDAFSYKALLWDLTFLYNQSAYLHMIWSYGNFNSHIGKNMGLSSFKTTIKHPETPLISNDLLLRNALGCSEEMRSLLWPVRSRYEFTVNWNKAVYTIEWELFVLQWKKRKPYTLQTLDEILYTDIAVAHFREGEKVDSYFQFSCQWDFSPIAVVEINEKFIEKE